MSFGTYGEWRQIVAVLCTILMAPGGVSLAAQQAAAGAQQPAPAAEKPKVKSPDQLDSLVAPIALYPDPLLGQVFAASTYPLEIVQSSRWLKANPKLAGEELTKAAAKQPWDPSVQALVAFPSAFKLLDENLQWTTDLGNAFLDQQGEVMDAVQRMRKKAKDGGKLETTKEQKIEVTTIENKNVIEIKPADPQVIYVPSYNPDGRLRRSSIRVPPDCVSNLFGERGVGYSSGQFRSGSDDGRNLERMLPRRLWMGLRLGRAITISPSTTTSISAMGMRSQRRRPHEYQRWKSDQVAQQLAAQSPAPQGRAVFRPVDCRKVGGSVRDSAGRMERFDRSGQQRNGGDRGGVDRGSQTRDVSNRSQSAGRTAEEAIAWVTAA